MPTKHTNTGNIYFWWLTHKANTDCWRIPKKIENTFGDFSVVWFLAVLGKFGQN